MSAPRVAVYGGSFNPPGTHHLGLVRDLAERFDEVLVVPCGPRPDKDTTNDTDPVHRAALCDLTFSGVPRVSVDLFDLEQATFTRTHDLDARYQHRGQIWHAIGSDLVQGGASGSSPIQRQWFRGEDLWRRLNFVVFERPGYEVLKEDLPPSHQLIETRYGGASSVTRERIFRHEPITGLVAPVVAEYIQRYRLYRGAMPQRASHLDIRRRPPGLIVDAGNPHAVALGRKFKEATTDLDNPATAIGSLLVIGGDGTMLRAIRQHWRRRLPLVGISAGHRGFLLNRAEDLANEHSLQQEFLVQHLPLLYVETLGPEGWSSSFAFNDAWVERASAQTAWIEVRVDDEVRLPKLISDGVLVSTAAGSTAYARAMGATPLRVDTPELLLVGSNVMEPYMWKSAHLSLESAIEFRALDPGKRPLRAFVDGIPQGEVTTMRLRKSRIAAVELAFTPERDLTAKLTEIQFPSQST